MATKTIEIHDSLYFEVSFGHETTEVTGYEYALEVDGEDDWFCTFNQRFSGYTLPAMLCKALMDMDKADDWQEAIEMLNEAGIYETDYDCDCGDCDNCTDEDTRTEFEKGTLPELDK